MNVGNIRTKEEAQGALVWLLVRFGSEAALDRLQEEAQFAKQSKDETAWRVAGNVLNSLVTRKPGGVVDL